MGSWKRAGSAEAWGYNGLEGAGPTAPPGLPAGSKAGEGRGEQGRAAAAIAVACAVSSPPGLEAEDTPLHVLTKRCFIHTRQRTRIADRRLNGRSSHTSPLFSALQTLEDHFL